MKIAIDAFRIVCEPRTSGAVYVAELAAALAARNDVEAIYLVIPDRPDPPMGRPSLDARKVHWVVADSAIDPSAGYHKQLWWVQHHYPRAIARQVGYVDWFVAPYHQTPVRLPRGSRALAVIHDLCGLRPDCGYKRLGRGYWRHMTNFLTARLGADAVVSISEYTHTELARILPALASRPYAVVYNAVTAPHLTAEQAAQARAGLALPPRYFLAYAAGGPRKGTDHSLKAYARYLSEGGNAALVLIGGRSAIAEWQPFAQAQGLGSSLHWLSGVSDMVRDALYAGAQALVFPSRCEGFGYPLVEAMRQGCPVIADRHSPAAEIVGATQPLLSTLAAGEIAAQMQTFERMAPSERAQLAQALTSRSQAFSDSDLAARFVDLMRSVVARA